VNGVCLDLWGKLGSEKGDRMHPLLLHCLDTGQVAACIWRDVLTPACREWLAACFGTSAEAMCSWLGFWASLHDIGKATPAFQSVARGRADDVFRRLTQLELSFPPLARRHRHDVLGRSVLARQVRQGLLPTGTPEELQRLLSTVTTGHHGLFATPGQDHGLARHTGNGDKAWQAQQDALTCELASYWRPDGFGSLVAPPVDRQAALMVLAGLISVADWIASDPANFPPAGSDPDVSSYLSGLPVRAVDALHRSGWLPPPPEVREAWSFHDLCGVEPNAMQLVATKAAVGLTRPGLVLIEAPMGLGKTEAAFAILADLLGRFGHRGAYIALPTQATSNQMFDRFGEFLTRAMPSGDVRARLLHGMAMLRFGGGGTEPRQVASDDNTPGSAHDTAAEEWFASSKRGLLAPFGVGTVDQGLLSVLQTRHHFVRLFGLAGKVVVLDEVHAYDTYTSELLQHLLRWLARLNCSVVLLSATLPRSKRNELLAAYCGRAVSAPEVSYPRVTVTDGVTANAVPVPMETSVEVHLGTVPDNPTAIAAHLRQAMAGGGCAACICNTVGRAQELFLAVRDALGADGCQVRLLHSRFPAGRRAEIERQVVQQFGKAGWKRGRPAKAVLVATQVVEQSLDLDFDVMVTDLAPVDLVLQRSGRLHRHRFVDGQPTVRPERLRQPQLWLVAPELDSVGLPMFGASAFVYEPYLLLRSYLSLLSSGRKTIRVPDDLEGLIEGVYGDAPMECPSDSWRPAMEKWRGELDRSSRLDQGYAGAMLIPLPDQPDGVLLAPSVEVEDEAAAAEWSFGGLTRKGMPSVRLICLHAVNGQVCLDAEGRYPAPMDRPPSRRELLELLEQSVSTTNRSVVEHFRDTPIPPGWAKAPMLRRCKAAEFENGVIGPVRKEVLRLDLELGLLCGRMAVQPNERI
jgi:CRISPR-associated endonuclease/helicase Cas3